MKNVNVKMLFVLAPYFLGNVALANPPHEVTIDTSTVGARGYFSVVLEGGDKSAAAELYRSLTQLEGIPDQDMGMVHYSETKSGKGVYCEFHSGKAVKDSYKCFLGLTPAGDPQKIGE